MLLVLLLALLQTSAPAPQASTQPAQWKLVWSDEFDGAAGVDAKKWAFERGYIRNKEAQYYTDRRENVRVEDGNLVIEARKEQFPIPNKPGEHARYTAGSIETRGHFDFTYGRVECRAKLPRGRGTWPAIWMLGSNIRKVGWPACGEIDIMEHVGFDPGRVHASVHTKAYNHVARTHRTAVAKIDDLEGFHVYAMEWTPEQVEIFVDDKSYYRFANEHKTDAEWPFAKDAFLKLNLAIGGEWGGQKGIDDSIFPQRFVIDYIRVFQRAPMR